MFGTGENNDKLESLSSEANRVRHSPLTSRRTEGSLKMEAVPTLKHHHNSWAFCRDDSGLKISTKQSRRIKDGCENRKIIVGHREL